MRFTKITEADSNHDKLEQMSVEQLSLIINEEDQTVANAVKKILPQINSFIDATLPKMQQGGRLIYIGAGTSGRLGILDASECPPTFGVSPELVIGLIAGGDGAIRTAVEGAEDRSESRVERFGKTSHFDFRYGCRNRRIRDNSLCPRRHSSVQIQRNYHRKYQL